MGITHKVDLLNGKIVPTLMRLALPIMGTSLVQMAYNLIDMIWIGKLSADAVAAVGAAGMYLWISQGLSNIPRVGGQVKAAQAIGAGNIERAAGYMQAAFHMGAMLMALFIAACLSFNGPMIGFFKLNSPEVVADARSYLIIVSIGAVFTFTSQIFTGMFTAMGASTTVLRSTSVGLVANAILDPLLIFGVGPFPRLEVAGAALATIIAQGLVCMMFIIAAKRDTFLFHHIRLLRKSQITNWIDVVRIGLPVALQSLFFSFLSMVIARLVAGWGDLAIAAQKVGGQIESISYMTAEGFGTAVNAFTAQNFGAKKPERIKKGYMTAIGIMAAWGIITTVILIVFPAQLFRIFITDESVLPIGVSYLRIMGYSQLFMCLEITSAGAFQGLGKPIPPTVTGILGNLARIPMAVMLSATVLGLDGVWWSITISSCAKGIVVFTWFVIILRRFLAKAREENDGGNVEKESLKVVRVVAAVIRREDRIFATAKGYGEFKGQWEFPGGKIETGESPKQALAREIREELDVEIQVGDLIETIEYDYPTFHLSMDCFWAEIISGEIVLKEAEKAKWLTKETIDSVNWLPADITLVNKLKEYLSDSKGKYE